jgi:hypothetical protein
MVNRCYQLSKVIGGKRFHISISTSLRCSALKIINYKAEHPQCELRSKILDYKSINYVGWAERSETQPAYFSVS